MNKGKLFLMEQELIEAIKSKLGKNLVSLVVEGSYANYDFIEGYSDYDLLVLVKNIDNIKKINLNNLAKKYKLDIQYVIRSYQDLINRIKNNNKATRFFTNLGLIKYKIQARVIWGKDITKMIPPVKEIIKRDLGCELRAEYLYATNPDKAWNIFSRKPRNWVNYIINMSNELLLSKGIIVKKRDIPRALKKIFPDFDGLKYVKEAVQLRESKKVLVLNNVEKNKLKKSLSDFLEEYKNFVSY